jgi:Holliday junction resolvase RusA-like endonuclease
MTGKLSIKTHTIGRWEIPVLAIDGSSVVIAFPVLGIIGNSVPNSAAGKKRSKEWKRAIAVAAKAQRGPCCWESQWEYALTIGFAFHRPSHGSQKFDLDNFVKPCVDALAAGIFCPDGTDIQTISKYKYDDSRFVRLFIQRLPDADHENEEGAAFYLTAIK